MAVKLVETSEVISIKQPVNINIWIVFSILVDLIWKIKKKLVLFLYLYWLTVNQFIHESYNICLRTVNFMFKAGKIFNLNTYVWVL